MPMKANLDHLARAQRQTEEYLDRDGILKQRLDDVYWAFQDLCDLIPQHWGKLFSGHFFPLAQAMDELRNCGALAHVGFYHHAIAGLRWVLELGMLSVYWDRADTAERLVQKWLRSIEKTPFRKNVLQGLEEIPNVARYCKQSTYIADFNRVYKELSNYQHVRGVRYSSRHLSHGNVTRFQVIAFEKWADLTFQVVRLVTTVHLLKYPVGLQETWIDQKFGLNPPMGGFLNPWQVDRLRSLFGSDDLAMLQAISDTDPEARKLAEEIAAMPDLTTEQRELQELRWAKDVIENQGFESWFQMCLRFDELSGADPGFREIAEGLKAWAAERGLLEHGRHGPPRGENRSDRQQPAWEWTFGLPPRDLD